ncbi:MBL fold metallo-hydrolase [Aurantiacibacter sediminis]|uniref:MBL fold metallo-hydrolase n=1 Tax=Aurantiacibacter sediminis TaxID=2793064 RepID=A0ABS0N6Q5_9SPHN|nr:MBL fold metallo-hydrolase [Aurantiacibacter sediminis]MBH5323514.1 MBL fold metallo-hydrolase [Aurantiacibacter sediminis]
MAKTPQAHDPSTWPTGDLEQLEPLVARVLAPNASAFTYTGTQTYLVGIEDLAVIDPGPADEEHLDALIRAIDGRPIRAIMCTHTHRDHSPAAMPLAERTGAPIVGCAPLRMEGGGGVEAAYDQEYEPDRVLEDGEAMTGAGWTLTALFTPGHISNHLCFALEETGVVFTGDHVMGWSTSVIVPPDGDMGDYMASLHKLYERDDRIYYPAHGPAVEKPKQLVRGNIGHRKAREGQILKLLTEAAQPIEDLVARMYSGVDKRLWPAAQMSVWAHLIHLEQRGLVNRSQNIWTARQNPAPAA